jgi:hypothetical protein
MPLNSEESLQELDPAAKMLRLEVRTALVVPRGTQILVMSNGLVGSKRKVKDGCAYFGTLDRGVRLSLALGQIPTNRLPGPS